MTAKENALMEAEEEFMAKEEPVNTQQPQIVPLSSPLTAQINAPNLSQTISMSLTFYSPYVKV